MEELLSLVESQIKEFCNEYYPGVKVRVGIRKDFFNGITFVTNIQYPIFLVKEKHVDLDISYPANWFEQIKEKYFKSLKVKYTRIPKKISISLYRIPTNFYGDDLLAPVFADYNGITYEDLSITYFEQEFKYDIKLPSDISRVYDMYNLQNRIFSNIKYKITNHFSIEVKEFENTIEIPENFVESIKSSLFPYKKIKMKKISKKYTFDPYKYISGTDRHKVILY